jgi:hypothetical protein
MTQENIEQDLQFIKKVLEDNRKRLVDNGIFYILWGFMAVLGTGISYIFIYLDMLYIFPYFWLGFFFMFFIIQRFMDKKKETNQHVTSFGWKIFNAVWLASGIAIILLCFLYFSTSLIPVTVFLFIIALIFGIAYFLSGIINDLKFITRLSYAWWVSAVVLLFWEQFINLYYVAMFFGALILFFQVIPGIIIYKKWKAEYAE